MKNKISIIVVIGLMVMLTACNMNGDTGAGENENGNQNRTLDRARNFANDGNRFGTHRANRSQMDNSFTQDRVYGNDIHPLHRNSRLEANERLAKAIAELDGVDSASAMLTDRNAYIGIVTDNNGGFKRNLRRMNTDDNGNQADNDFNFGQYTEQNEEVADELKEKVSKRVRELHPEVENVYVSANPNFVERLDNMIQSMGSGRPVRGLVNEFNTLVERIFPENK